MKKELLDSFEAIKDPCEDRGQIFAVEPIDIVLPCQWAQQPRSVDPS